MVHTPDSDTDFFDIVTEVLQGNILVLLFIFCYNYILQTSMDLIKENSFKLKKTISRWYPAETMTQTMQMI